MTRILAWLPKLSARTWSLLAMALCIPGALTGLSVDDLWILHTLTRVQTLSERALRAFDFATPERLAAAQELGELTWWTQADFKLRFLRPLAALSHALDLELFGVTPLAMHLVSMLWLGALVLATCAWYRRLFGQENKILALASGLYALSPGHVFAGSWLANRNACMAATFGVLSLLSHDRARRGGSRALSLLSALCLALALASGESGLCVVGLLVAHAWCLDDAPWTRRLFSLLPTFAVVLAWAVIYRPVLGFGVHGSSLYIDPVSSPRVWLTSALPHLLGLVLSQWLMPLAFLWVLLSKKATWVIAAVALVFLSLLARSVVDLVKRDRRARFGLVGGVVASLPTLSTSPHDRLLLISNVAMLGLLAQWTFGACAPGKTGLLRAKLVGLRLALSVPIALACSGSLAQFAKLERTPFANTQRDPGVSKSTLVFVNPPSAFFAMFMPMRRSLEGGPVPERIRCLAPGIYPSVLKREGDHTLVVRVERGFLQPRGTLDVGKVEDQDPFLSPAYIPQTLDNLVLSGDQPMRVGKRVELSDVVVEVREVTDGGLPVEVAFGFKRGLDHPSLRFLEWKDGGYHPFALPQAGGERVLAGLYDQKL